MTIWAIYQQTVSWCTQWTKEWLCFLKCLWWELKDRWPSFSCLKPLCSILSIMHRDYYYLFTLVTKFVLYLGFVVCLRDYQKYLLVDFWWNFVKRWGFAKDWLWLDFNCNLVVIGIQEFLTGFPTVHIWHTTWRNKFSVLVVLNSLVFFIVCFWLLSQAVIWDRMEM